MNTNHLFKQMMEDETIEVKPTLSSFANELYERYINTLNNESDPFYNAEDVRTPHAEKFLYTSEIGVKINKNDLLWTGHCAREQFFTVTGAYGEPRKADELDIHERNALIKEQWLRRFRLAELLVDRSKASKRINDVEVVPTNDGFIYNPERNVEYVLVIKPINDTAMFVRDEIWPNYGTPKPNKSHLSEIAALAVFYKMPVKLLYVGKNRPELTQEFDFGVSNGILNYTIKGTTVETAISLVDILISIRDFKYAVDNNFIPPRSYIKKRQLNGTEIEKLLEYALINPKTSQALARGEEYQDYHCQSCRYSNLCDSISEGWVNRNE